jgi:peptidoglycan/LPS O-acetylase OafA/YrhL
VANPTILETPQRQETADPRAHYVELDSLRGLAILAVVVAHVILSWESIVPAARPLVALNVPFLDVNALYLRQIFVKGLPLFLMLSGYLLTWTEGKRAQSGRYSVRSYALRRVLRICPAYYVAIVVVLVVSHYIYLPWQTAGAEGVLLHAFFLNGFDPSPTLDPAWWSLSAEVVFYALLPFIVLKASGLGLRLALFGVSWLVLFLGGEWLLTHDLATLSGFTLLSLDTNAYISLYPVTVLWAFMAGVAVRAVAERLEYSRPSSLVSRLRPVLTCTVFSASLAYLLLYPYSERLGAATMELEAAHKALLTWPHIVENLAMIALFASALLGVPFFGRVLRWRALAWVGKISYSMFLFHQVILLPVHLRFQTPLQIWAAQNGSLATWVAFSGYVAAILAASILVAYLSYRYIESPFMRYKPR